MDEGAAVDVVYLNIAKPFDKVPTARLLLRRCSTGSNSGLLEESREVSLMAKPQAWVICSPVCLWVQC